jgi:putative membrane protein
MLGFLIRAAITGLGLWLAAHFLDGVAFASTQKLVIAALVLGVVNAFVRPVAFVLTLPITLVTLGLFLFVLNAAMIGLVAKLIPGFTVDGFWTAVGAAIIVGLTSWIASSLFGRGGRFEIYRPKH